MRIAIINYGMGNLRSVMNAIEALGYCGVVAERPVDLVSADKIILPGVGAFGDGMRNLQSGDWIEVLDREVRQKGKPFLGLCLGLQLLATTGTEHGINPGLNWVEGTVERLTSEDPEVRIPHIGWNDVQVTSQAPMYTGLSETETFYFVHSYVLRPVNTATANGLCSHGEEFVASLQVDNIWATQFHPEKSQAAGLKLLGNFLAVKS